MNKNNLTVFCDGGARGNPGPSASAFVVIDSAGNILYENGELLGNQTNNYAEYYALISALKWLVENKKNIPVQVTIKLDSELVVKQTNGLYKIKNNTLMQLAVQVKTLKAELNGQLKIVHIPRKQNSLADSIVNRTLDG